jgi:hypothetical protein
LFVEAKFEGSALDTGQRLYLDRIGKNGLLAHGMQASQENAKHLVFPLGVKRLLV